MTAATVGTAVVVDEGGDEWLLPQPRAGVQLSEPERPAREIEVELVLAWLASDGHVSRTTSTHAALIPDARDEAALEVHLCLDARENSSALRATLDPIPVEVGLPLRHPETGERLRYADRVTYSRRVRGRA
jgi:hypothetical protein